MNALLEGFTERVFRVASKHVQSKRFYLNNFNQVSYSVAEAHKNKMGIRCGTENE